jgi:hypothetical protein
MVIKMKTIEEIAEELRQMKEQSKKSEEEECQLN